MNQSSVERQHKFPSLRNRYSCGNSLETRDISIDVAKGFLILLMLVGYYGSLESNFRDGIYSFHMMAFVILSGYFFNPEKSKDIRASVLHLFKAFLVPYAVFGAVYICLTHDGMITEIKRLVFGISYTKNWFTNIASIGPVYFILMLFLVRLIYIFIAKYFKGWHCTAAVIVVSVTGYFLGLHGYWMPWSFDCAMFGVAFYHIGYLLKKWNLLERIIGWYPSYFVLSCFWIFMIYKGGMELATRNYGSYSITILGAVSATLLLLMLVKALCSVLPAAIVRAVALVGESTLYILILHKLFNSDISAFCSRWLTSGYIYHMILWVFVTAAAGMCLYILIRMMNNSVMGLKRERQSDKGFFKP